MAGTGDGSTGGEDDPKKKRWILLGILGVLVAGGAIVAARSKDKSDVPKELPFRLGKVQAEDLQVCVREVGVVDPVTKVDVKSAGVRARRRAEGPRGGRRPKSGDVLAEIEPDVNQAQSLSDVQAGVTDQPISSCRTPSASSPPRRRCSTAA